MKQINRISIGVLACLLSIAFAGWAFGSSQTTSGTTAATMIDRVEARLNDEDNRMWPAGDLLAYLNEGMVDIVTRTHCLEGTATETLVADTVEYPLSSFTSAITTYTTVKTVHYIDSDSKSWGLKKGSPQSVGQGGEDDPDSTPGFWYEWNGSIGVYPPLASINVSTAESIKIYYIDFPAAIASGGTIVTPAIYDNALLMYIMGQAYLRDNQLNRFLQTINLYDLEMARIRQDLTEYPAQAVK